MKLFINLKHFIRKKKDIKSKNSESNFTWYLISFDLSDTLFSNFYQIKII